MGAVYAINATLKLQEKKRKDLFEKLSSEIMEDLTSGEVNWGDIQKPETLEECLGLIFVEHQKMYDIKISKDKEQETIEIDSGFNASYGWESVMINYFKTSVLGVSWNIRETFFKGNEDAEDSIKTLGAYIRHVRIGDCKNGLNVLIGEGELPVQDFMDALRSLNYDGFVCADWNDDITDADIVLTHFMNYMEGCV